MATEETCSFIQAPAEIRNKIFRCLVQGARLWLSGDAIIPQTQSMTLGFPATDPNTSTASFHAVDVDFPWQLAATCKQIRAEFLPFLPDATLLWLYNGINFPLSIDGVVPTVYCSGIKNLRVSGDAAIAINFTNMPALENIEFTTDPIEWVIHNKKMVNDAFKGIKNNAGLIESSRQLIRENSVESIVFLESGNVPQTVQLIVSAVVRARLPSKMNISAQRGFANTVPSKDDVDVTFELLYNWRSGAIVAGQVEIEKARGDLIGRLEHDKEVEGMWVSNNEEHADNDAMSACSEGTKDEYARQIDEWNDREGELYVVKGREWAFRGAVEEIEGEIGPGKL